MSALADVARLAGVSKSTASRALNGTGYVSRQTRARVQQAASAMGYVASSAAASLVTGRTLNVGVVIPYLNRWFFAEVLEGIEEALIRAGYDLSLYRLSAEPGARRRIFDYFLIRKRVDAVIAVGVELTPAEIDLLRSLGKPIVGLGGPIVGISTLSIDDIEAARIVTNHLIALRHTRILHLGGDLDNQMDFRVHAHRLAGYTEAMTAAGLSAAGGFRPTGMSIEGGYEVARSVLADPRQRPTAIVAGCDEVAIGVIVAARELGIHVPSELSVIGIDDHDLAGMFGLTTLRQVPSEQGRLSVELLMAEIDAAGVRSTPARVSLPLELRVRHSTTAVGPGT